MHAWTPEIRRARQPVTWLLVPLLLLVFTAAPVARAQTLTTDPETGGLTSSSSSGSDYSDDILIGLFVVVVGILIVLGIQSDRSTWNQRSMPEAYAFDTKAREGSLQYPHEAHPELVGEATWDVTGLGLRARF